MIPKPTLTAWRKIANWPMDEQVEQDLIISATLVDIFNDPYLKDKIAFRGGTALHKLILPKALRYSEDIDLNRLERGPAKSVIDAIRKSLKPRLGNPSKVKRTTNSIKVFFDYNSVSGGTGRLKVEVNVRETLPQRPLKEIPYTVNSEYFGGSTLVKAFADVELIGTKIRALYQRNKGRDLFDLYEVGKQDFNWKEIVDSFKKLNIGASQYDFEKNLENKMNDSEFLEDINLLLPSDVEYDPAKAYAWFVKEVLPRL